MEFPRRRFLQLATGAGAVPDDHPVAHITRLQHPSSDLSVRPYVVHTQGDIRLVRGVREIASGPVRRTLWSLGEDYR